VNDPVSQAALERALDEKEDLVLLYQPIHDLRTRSVVSAEALLRQRRSNGELREAAIIHEAAEESAGNEIFVLDHHLVSRAYTDAARWQAANPQVRLNVNLSPREFEHPGVVERITGLLTVCGIVPDRVNLEITETSYIRHPKRTTHVLDAVRELGIHLWLDDFGTEFSSLTHLQRFPVAGIKLAGSFVGPLPSDRRSAAIVRALLALAHDLEIEVVAEEVEREDQLAFLRDLGCHYVQGFLFSRPMELAELELFLRS
jgi:EAL domain-containing protein (putative c-di-GMP-specific phosphodiesterase class I)